ncbi:uncharacterized protein LOC126235247 [Schistocerca nitens]|uniref:uncharacterized protein LOC126235247 n=1 Tax=Schistocerca nitens TaxID=7011 RepID=UPI002118CDA3|nr:uncharacterized protein LOC126235247 [Schistocerca nitens]
MFTENRISESFLLLCQREAFGLQKHLMRPYSGTHSTLEKRIFNYRLCRARRHVECAFGILSNTWRVFHRPINEYPDFAVDIIKMYVVLHNFVCDQDECLPEDTITITGLENLTGEPTVQDELQANNVQNILIKYLVSTIGTVPWQMGKI